MTRSRKILATVALTVGVLGGMASPALADSQPDLVSSPPENHPDFAASDSQPDFMPPPPENYPG